MKKVSLRLWAMLILLLVCLPLKVSAEVIISELCDPRLNYATDRFIEIYNTGAEAVDLTGWRIIAVANGADVFTWNLSGLIDSHQALVAGDETTVAIFPVAFPDESWSGATGSWNGKVGDGAKLVNASEATSDYVVATVAEFENADYVRKGDITAPSAVYLPEQWTATSVELATDASPGSHSSESPLIGPAIDSIQRTPAWPVVGDSVHIDAEITDIDANITEVSIKWGLLATSLTNQINMSLVSGDGYRTDTPIPAQAAGATVYYRVEAMNDLPATTISNLNSYALAYTLTLHEIQGEATSSPYDGLMVTTHGVVSACYGTTYVLQDGSGMWNGLWVRGATAPSLRDSLTVLGRVTETGTPGDSGNTMLVDAQIIDSVRGADFPDPISLSTAAINSEAYEGVLVRVTEALCLDPDLGAGEWRIDDGSGASSVGVLGYSATPTLGSTYEVSGPVAYSAGQYKIEPRDSDDVQWTADQSAPVVFSVAVLNEMTLRVFFSETVEPISAGTTESYDIPGLSVNQAVRESSHTDQVLLTVSPMTTGDYTLTVSGVADSYGNATVATGALFSYISPDIPSGYYDGTEGLDGEALKLALHNIIRNHTSYSYTYAWTAYYTTDDRPDNGKVWDIYSDIPGGTPPYLYTFGVNEGGVGGAEGTGYTREHTWCKSWFGGEVSPMYTDLFTLFPCDTHMNGTRGIYAYGETANPQLISQNGSQVGPSSVPGYAGIVFEPIDDFKGDLARAYMYFSTRYYTEDSGWPGGPATDGALLKPWALDMFLQWIDEDPVSQKEIDRNSAIYLIQGNRNPFVDRPEFVDLVFDSTTTGMEVIPEDRIPTDLFKLYGASPNPFNPHTTIEFSLSDPGLVTLTVYDVSGRRIRTLVEAPMSAGRQKANWDGVDANGRRVASGPYFLRLETDQGVRTRKVMLMK